MNDNMRKFVRGLMVSTVSQGVLPKKQEPVAYLYNGVSLPPLPEWDRETYPYAVISEIGDGAGKELTVMAEPPNIYRSIFSSSILRLSMANGSYGIFTAGPYDADWGEPTYIESGDRNCELDDVIWCNSDIHYPSGTSYGDLAGTLFLAASEPVPDYSADTRVELTDMGTYSYNGEKYPKLPETAYWDRDTYPYAAIEDYGGDTVNLYVSNLPMGFYYYETLGYALAASTESNGVSFSYVKYTYNKTGANNFFRFAWSATATRLSAFVHDTVWTNTDLYQYDKDTGEATLVLAASEPVPVYE